MNIFKGHKTYDEVLDEYLEDRKIELSRCSYLNRMSQFKVITNWMHDQGLNNIALRKIDQPIIARFFRYLGAERNLDRSTCGKYYIIFRTLFRFAAARKYISVVPFENITLPRKKGDFGAKVVQRDELSTLLCDIRDNNFQLYVACLFLYYCFIRPGNELRLMRVGEVDLVAGVVRIPANRAKSRRTEVVTIPTQLVAICKEYGLEGADKSLYIFGKGGKISNRPWSVNALAYKFNFYRDRLGISKDIKFYSMKHTGVTMLAESGVSIRSIMDQCRHTNLSATQHYLKKHAGLVDVRIRDCFPSPV